MFRISASHRNSRISLVASHILADFSHLYNFYGFRPTIYNTVLLISSVALYNPAFALPFNRIKAEQHFTSRTTFSAPR